MFNSLHASLLYNPLLKAIVDILINQEHQLKVLHVPGEQNEIADLLSRDNFHPCC
ncbi:hypothetical protein J132_04738 [Termitomyces sp. J132]|nr:hypothetical protein J132_04738 [Termitomyces sp. J132]